MVKQVDKETGEVKVVRSLNLVVRGVHPSVGMDFSYNIIQNHDFQWDNDKRDFVIVETDKEDRDAYIQSFAKETGIYNIMKMYAKTGDASLLNKKQGFYGDISNLPVDELNPAKVEKAAASAVKSLNKALGVNYSAEQLASMSVEDLEKVVADAISAMKAKQAPVEDKKDGE